MGMSDVKAGAVYKAKAIQGTLQGQSKQTGSVQIAIDCMLIDIDKEKGGLRVPTIMTAKNKNGSMNEYTRDRLLTMGWDGKAKAFGGYWLNTFDLIAKEDTYEGVTKIIFEVRTENQQFKFKDELAATELEQLSEMFALGGAGEARDAAGGYDPDWEGEGNKPATKKVSI